MRAGRPAGPAGLATATSTALARGLALVVNTLDPDVLVMGGGMSNVDELYADCRRGWRATSSRRCFYTPVVRAAHGDSSGVRGAAWLWK